MTKIAHISDIHFGTITDARIVDALVEQINADQPALLVCSGDLTQRARAWQYREAANFLKRFNSPTLVVPGNHDVPLWDLFHRLTAPLKNYRRFVTPDLQPVFRNDQMVVVGINTARPFTARLGGFWKDGAISIEQARSAVQQFEKLGDDVARIIVTHHPFLAPPGKSNEDVVHGAAGALKIFEEARVDLLLAGHLHASYRGDPRDVTITQRQAMMSLQAGTATSGRTRHEANAYNMIQLERRQIEVAIRRWSGTAFEGDESVGP